MEVYHQNKGDASGPTAGLSILPKIKLEHIKLTSYSRMRVDLAAQVLSDKVSKAIEANGHSETAKFCAVFNKFFDCMNVRSTKEYIHKRNPNLKPYKIEDERFQVYIL